MPSSTAPRIRLAIAKPIYDALVGLDDDAYRRVRSAIDYASEMLPACMGLLASARGFFVIHGDVVLNIMFNAKQEKFYIAALEIEGEGSDPDPRPRKMKFKSLLTPHIMVFCSVMKNGTITIIDHGIVLPEEGRKGIYVDGAVARIRQAKSRSKSLAGGAAITHSEHWDHGLICSEQRCESRGASLASHLCLVAGDAVICPRISHAEAGREHLRLYSSHDHLEGPQ